MIWNILSHLLTIKYFLKISIVYSCYCWCNKEHASLLSCVHDTCCFIITLSIGRFYITIWAYCINETKHYRTTYKLLSNPQAILNYVLNIYKLFCYYRVNAVNINIPKPYSIRTFLFLSHYSCLPINCNS